MSSLEVREAINTAVAAAAAPWPVFNLSDFITLEEALGEYDSESILIQYITAGEFIASIGGENNNGWEEDGTVVLHMVVPTGFASTPTVTKGDEIRNALKGKRLTSQITIESCEPFTDFGGGATGLYSGAWHGWASNLYYVRRSCG